MVSANENLRSTIFILSAVVLVALIARAGRWRYALGVGTVVCYLATTSIFTGTYLPYDPAGSLMMVAFLLGGLWAGTVLRSISLRHAAERKRLAEEVENHREQLMFTLHDSVATTLTSVVMRAETLGLELDGKEGDDARLIAEETRQAMQEVRHLLQVMRDGENAGEHSIVRSVGDQLDVTKRLLQSHGFDVDTQLAPELQNRSFPAGIERVFTEMATNAVKYALPSSQVELTIQTIGDSCRVALVNAIRPLKRASHLSSGIGLRESRKILKTFGSRLETKRIGNQWRAEFALPLTKLHQ